MEVKQLVYKTYLTPERKGLSENTRGYQLTTIGQNLTYINQLNSTFSDCPDFKLLTPKTITYNKASLLKVFNEYHSCVGVQTTSSYNSEIEYKFRIRPGLDLSASNFSYYHNKKYSPSLNFRLGLELGLVLPYNKKKWELLIEPTFQNYKLPNPTELSYQSIELAAGLRYKFPIVKDINLFLNSSLVVDLSVNCVGKWPNGTTFESKSVRLINTTGGGILYKRFHVEYRYYTKRTRFSVLGDPIFDFSKSSIVLGYQL